MSDPKPAPRREPPRRPKGHQPQYFDDPAVDQLHSALLALATELCVAFDRIDTLEELLEKTAGIAREQIDGFEPGEASLARRAARRTDVAERLLRPFREYREALFERAEHAAAVDAAHHANPASDDRERPWTGAGASR